MGDPNASFPRLVSLAAHDLRTPLATIHGFAQTLVRMGDLGEPKQRYMEMIDSAALQLAELLDELGVAARIESGRYEPALQPTDTLELARGAAEQLGEERVVVTGEGAEVRVDADAVAARRLRAGAGRAASRRARAGRAARRRRDAHDLAGHSLFGAGPARRGAARSRRRRRGDRHPRARGSVSLDGDTLAVKLPE